MALSFKSIQRTLLRHESAWLKIKPKTSEEIQKSFENPDVMENFGFTIRQQNPTRFYKTLVIQNNYKFCVFASDEIIELIKSNIAEDQRDYMMDATFKVCPYGDFNQLLIIYIAYCGEVSAIYYIVFFI